MSDEDRMVEGVIARKVVAWLLAGGLALSFAVGAWAMDKSGRLTTLEKGQFTREEAQQLRSSVDLLRVEIGYLRRDLTAAEDRRTP